MSEDSSSRYRSRKGIGLITVFITSSLIVIICVLMKNDKTERSCPFIKQPYRSCLENPLIVVNAVTGISTSHTIN
jgi:hypothetical protein